MSINYIKDYYHILEISQTAPISEIREAYKRLALRFHPDKSAHENKIKTQEKFIEIREAYEVLKNDDLRRDYDKNYQDPSFGLFREFVTRRISIAELEEFLKAEASVDAHNALNQTILMYAANRGDIEMVKFLIKNNASITIVDVDGNTPLMYAAMKETVKFDIDNKSILEEMFSKFFNATSTAKESANEYAESVEEIEEIYSFFNDILEASIFPKEKNIPQLDEDKATIAQIFIDNGASIYETNYHNKTVLDYAIDFHNVPLMNLLYRFLGMEDQIIPEYQDISLHETMSSALALHDSVAQISRTGSKLKMTSLTSTRESSDNLEVVIVRYEDDLSWVAKEFPHDKVTIYNKGPNDIGELPSNWKVIHKEKAGYLGGSYLKHIIDNYYPLEDHYMERSWDLVFDQKFHAEQSENHDLSLTDFAMKYIEDNHPFPSSIKLAKDDSKEEGNKILGLPAYE